MGWDNQGCRVTTGKASMSSILFARKGSKTVYQKETAITQLIKGLTEEGGLAQVPVSVDNTTQKTYYALIDEEVFSITVTTGSKTDYSGSRVDDSGQWQVTVTTTEYSVENLDTTLWRETKITSDGVEIELSSGGVEKRISYDKSTSYVFSYAGNTLFSTNTCEVVEFRYIDSYSNATSLASRKTSNTIQYKSIQCSNQGGSYWVSLPVGSESHASVSQASDGEGWTVSVTTTTHGWTGSGWSEQ
jgi:hypothetical protein